MSFVGATLVVSIRKMIANKFILHPVTVFIYYINIRCSADKIALIQGFPIVPEKKATVQIYIHSQWSPKFLTTRKTLF